MSYEGALSGNVQSAIQSALQSWNQHIDDQIDALLTSSTAFDGTALFASSRPNLDTGSNTVNNIHTGTGTTLAQIQADLTSGLTLLYGMKDKANKPFNRGGDLTIVVPRHLYQTAMILVNSTMINLGSGVQDNIYKGIAQVVVNEAQASTNNDWYIVNSGNAFRPFIVQTMENPKFQVEDTPSSPYIKFISSAYMGFGAGNPVSIVKVNN